MSQIVNTPLGVAITLPGGVYIDYALASALSTNACAMPMTTFAACSITSSEMNSSGPWKFSPPVKRFGVGSP